MLTMFTPNKLKRTLRELIVEGEELYRILNLRVFRFGIYYQVLDDETFQSAYQKWIEDVRNNVLIQQPEIDASLFDLSYIELIRSTNFFGINSQQRELEVIEKTRVYKDFVNHVNKQLSALKKDKAKISVYIDTRKGIYRYNDEKNKLIYKHLSPTNKIFKTVQFLINKKSATINVLSKHTRQDPKSTKASIKRFNIKFMKDLDVSFDAVEDNKSGEYFLNTDKYDFQ